MADTSTQANNPPLPGAIARLIDHQGEVDDLGHIATCLRAMTDGDRTLDKDEAAAVYWLASIAAERVASLAEAMGAGTGR